MKKHNIVVLALVAIIFVVVFLPTLLSWISARKDFDNNFTHFTKGNISSIDVSQDFRSPTIFTVTDKSNCDAFFDAIKRQEPYTPNHPKYNQKMSFSITLRKGDPIQIIVSTMEGRDFAYCDYVRSTGTHTSYFGTFKSKELYRWLINNKVTEQVAASDR
ncbi:MAG: hypothetical protein KJO69_04820 [Gammaproteobacteria bacterium]|nr:hypothetical protein [Gammaproteobacteria bacterium]